MAHKKLHVLAAACGLLTSGAAWAQQALPAVTVTGSAANSPLSVGGLGDTPLAKLPVQANVLSADQLADWGVNQLMGLTSIDASIADSYNAEGYVSYLDIRGFDLDNHFNYRRDGLPIDANTALPLGNTSAVEILKGTSGIQAGTSAPGGLVNLVVKRPLATDQTTLTIGISDHDTVESSLDWSRRFGEQREFGLRINLDATHLNPQLMDAKGHRELGAVAADWHVSPDTFVEAEFETSQQSEPDQPGFSMLGSVVPDPHSINPNINLNDQPWSQPTIFNNRTASLRITQRLDADWSAQLHWGTQRLVNDDRLAFPFGCSADGYSYTDRYCPNGDFDMYDFASNNEHRNSEALDLSLSGKFTALGMAHDLGIGVLLSRFESRLQGEAYNYVGTGNISGQVVTPDDPSLGPETNSNEHSREFYLHDAIDIAPQWRAWLGLRNTALGRATVQTDGTQPTDYSQSFTTPWLGLSYALSPQHMLYASWGQGVQSNLVTQLPTYTNAGQALQEKSQQLEFGLKAGSHTVDWSLAWFDIKQSALNNIGACDGSDNSCTTELDGSERHRGVEAQADLKWQGGGLLGSVMQLNARRFGSANPTLNGLQPTNVPATQAKLQLRQDMAAGWQAQAGLIYEGRRAVLPDNSVFIPGWARVDLGARYDQTLAGKTWTWRVGVDNAANRRAWRESPYQYEHVYLYPLAPRTWRTSLEVQL